MLGPGISVLRNCLAGTPESHFPFSFQGGLRGERESHLLFRGKNSQIEISLDLETRRESGSLDSSQESRDSRLDYRNQERERTTHFYNRHLMMRFVSRAGQILQQY